MAGERKPPVVRNRGEPALVKKNPRRSRTLGGRAKSWPPPRREQQPRRRPEGLRGRFAPCAARHGNATCSHPDYTVGPGLSPVSCLGPVGLGSRAEEARATPSITAGRELAARRRPHPAPQVVVIPLYGTADPRIGAAANHALLLHDKYRGLICQKAWGRMGSLSKETARSPLLRQRRSH